MLHRTVNNLYEIIGEIGSGSHAIVWKAWNKETNEHVAIKELLNQHDKQISKRTYREIRLLEHFSGHPNIISVKDLLTDKYDQSFQSVMIVMQLMDTDLDSLIKSRARLSLDHIRWFIYQILCGLKCIHSANVIHRDLKPQNILVNSNCDIKLCDFGTGRGNEERSLRMTFIKEVATAYYRAPDGILNQENYTKSVDLWAVGCILAETLTRVPIFPAKNNKVLLEIIVSHLGSPTTEEMNKFPESKYKAYLSKLVGNRQTLENLIPNADPQALDLIEKLLVFDPDKRIGAEQALEHPFLEEHHQPDEEPTCKIFDNIKEKDTKICAVEWKDLLWKEIQAYHAKKQNFAYKDERPNDSKVEWLGASR